MRRYQKSHRLDSRKITMEDCIGWMRGSEEGGRAMKLGKGLLL